MTYHAIRLRRPGALLVFVLAALCAGACDQEADVITREEPCANLPDDCSGRSTAALIAAFDGLRTSIDAIAEELAGACKTMTLALGGVEGEVPEGSAVDEAIGWCAAFQQHVAGKVASIVFE